MGWDAYTNVKRDIQGNLEDDEINLAFLEASEFVRQKAGSVDGYLYSGGLDCSACARMLEKATNRSCWGDLWIPPIEANWDFEYEEPWAYWSAKKFLEVCTKFNLTINFSW